MRPSAFPCAALAAIAVSLAGCGGGGGGSSATVSPPPPPANKAPEAVASASADSAWSSQAVQLDGTASSDADGQISSYRWTRVSGPAVNIDAADSANASFVVPPLDGADELRLRLEVTDDDGATAAAEVAVRLDAAPIVYDVEVADGAGFKVDDESVGLLLRSATLEGNPVTPLALEWSSSLQGGVASGFGVNERIDADLEAGAHALTLTGDFGDFGIVRFSTDFRVRPRMLPVPAYLSTPAAGHKQRVRVVLVSHLPTTDGVNLDTTEANYTYRPPEWSGNNLDDLLAYIDTINVRKKFILEEMSRFRGYKTSNDPYLGYEIAAHFAYYEPMPRTARTNPFDPNQRMADFAGLMAKIGGRDWVENQSVGEFWFNNYLNADFQFWESNMSSPTTGDISNSDQFTGDLPIYNRTYVVYGTNYHRTQAEAIHNHGHQIERMLDYVDRLHSGDSELFWGKFVGVPGYPGPPMIPGRCGWTHQPPNTTTDYGYSDQTPVEVDCEDWRPDGTGAKVAVNSAYFEALSYAWPEGVVDIPQKAETQFYIWWGQNMPGDGNTIPYESTTMENWWRIIGDWDTAIATGVRLYR